MKRDMDLIRTLLLKVEAMPADPGRAFGIDWQDEFFDIPGHDRNQAIQHFDLLIEAGFLLTPSTQGMQVFVINGLSWKGHEFLDDIRNPEAWSRTKGAMHAVGGFGLDMAAKVAKAYLKEILKQHVGLDI